MKTHLYYNQIIERKLSREGSATEWMWELTSSQFNGWKRKGAVERMIAREKRKNTRRRVEMKKKNFVSMVLGTVGGILFAIGMCMCLLPEWGALTQGVIIAAVGIVVLLAMLLVRRKMEGKPAVKLNGRAVITMLIGVVGALAFGVGMCMSMVWGMMIPGILVGIFGIVILLCLIPRIKGLEQ